ncbi:HAD-IIB family hydrolase [Paenibacillus sp. ClWae2A]|uniref:HAD-IIB family hydrolase n=1 Tax=Paenibacillus sp. ClWae2A TaxID=3057177 RepID=UPI0037CAE016
MFQGIALNRNVETELLCDTYYYILSLFIFLLRYNLSPGKLRCSAISSHADLEGAITTDQIRCSKFSYFGVMDELIQLEAKLNQMFSGQIETFISDHDCLDVMPCNVSKGDALKLLIHKLGISPDEIACIGDSFNDLSMFALTPHSFAISESHEEIRSRTSTIVHSVAEAINHIISYNYSSSAT